MTSMRFFKRIVCTILAMCLIVFSGLVCSAEGPYNNYTYNAWDKSVPTAAGYLPSKLVIGKDLGIESFCGPKDIFYDNQDAVYILDADENTKQIIVISSKDYSFVRKIEPTVKNGEKLKLVNPTGIFVRPNGDIYLADKDAGQVFILDHDGALIGSIGCPDSDLLTADFAYKPCKVAVDSNGIVYVISYGCYSGAMQFDAELNFIGFFGSETVTMTAKLVFEKMWAKIVPKSMSKKQSRAVPVNYNNFDIDSNDMIYTTKNDVESNVSQVRKLNYYGNSLLVYKTAGNTRTYGDIETYYDSKKGLVQSIISDIDVDADGYFTILDTRRNRIFQFDQNSNLLFSFGGTSAQLGCFLEAVALETVGTDVLVIDGKNNSLTVFGLTPYGALQREASAGLADGKYVENKSVFQELLRYDSKNMLANVGLGKAYQAEGKYGKSLKYFKEANDTLGYSNSLYVYRSNVLKQSFAWIMIAVVFIFIGSTVLSVVRKKRHVSDYYLSISAKRYPFYVMTHPFKGPGSLRESGKGSLIIANIIVALFFFVNVFVRQNTSFLFSSARKSDFNILYTLVGTVGVFVVFVLCNWAVGTLMDGEGKLKHLWITCAYALMPYVVLMIPLTIISNALVLDEGAFYYAAVYLVYAWVGLELLVSVIEIQQFTFGKTLIAILLTVLGIVIVAALYAMAYSMLSQLFSFIITLFSEILMRV